jgi:hypothetical protein
MSEAPAELWVSLGKNEPADGFLEDLWLQDDAYSPDAVRYVRADLYEALQERMRVVRSWNEAPCLAPLGHDIY